MIVKSACGLVALVCYVVTGMLPLSSTRPMASGCPSSCDVWEDIVQYSPISVSGGIVDSPRGDGECKCNGEVCELKKNCNLTASYTFDAGANWLCRGGSSYGHTETEVLTVSQCGDSKFTPSYNSYTNAGCSGAASGFAYANLNCEKCSDSTCP